MIAMEHDGTSPSFFYRWFIPRWVVFHRKSRGFRGDLRLFGLHRGPRLPALHLLRPADGFQRGKVRFRPEKSWENTVNCRLIKPSWSVFCFIKMVGQLRWMQLWVKIKDHRFQPIFSMNHPQKKLGNPILTHTHVGLFRLMITMWGLSGGILPDGEHVMCYLSSLYTDMLLIIVYSPRQRCVARCIAICFDMPIKDDKNIQKQMYHSVTAEKSRTYNSHDSTWPPKGWMKSYD